MKQFWINEYENAVNPVGVSFLGGKTGREELPYTHVVEAQLVLDFLEGLVTTLAPNHYVRTADKAKQLIKLIKENNKC
jgi:hypothetical protein